MPSHGPANDPHLQRRGRGPASLEQLQRDLADPNTSPQIRTFIQRQMQILQRQAASPAKPFPTGPFSRPGGLQPVDRDVTTRHAIGGSANPIGGLQPVDNPGGFTTPQDQFNPPVGGRGTRGFRQASSNPWLDFLNENQDIAFQAFAPQTGSRSFLDYVQSQKGSVRDIYQGVLGRRALQGLPPDLEFTDFLRNFDFRGRFDALSPTARGAGASRFAPSLRRII